MAQGATEQEILQELVSAWVSLGLEYASSAPDVSALYIYASSEHGFTVGNVYFEQSGVVVFPDHLAGAHITDDRVRRLQDLMYEDLARAEERFGAIGIPAPTEYRIYYEPRSRKLDVQLEREPIYQNDPERSPVQGIEYWLGDRAPKMYGPR